MNGWMIKLRKVHIEMSGSLVRSLKQGKECGFVGCLVFNNSQKGDSKKVRCAEDEWTGRGGKGRTG